MVLGTTTKQQTDLPDDDDGLAVLEARKSAKRDDAWADQDPGGSGRGMGIRTKGKGRKGGSSKIRNLVPARVVVLGVFLIFFRSGALRRSSNRWRTQVQVPFSFSPGRIVFSVSTFLSVGMGWDTEAS